MQTYVLNDGTQVEIRPIAADDGERLQVAHQRLSPETQYRRYLGAKPVLTPDDARYLVEVDCEDHVALVATVPVDGDDEAMVAVDRDDDEAMVAVDRDDEAIVAVARFVRLPHDPAAAEFAIVVGDAFQRQGLGGELMRHLVPAALERGITHFRATTHTDNRGLFAVLEAVIAPSGLTIESRGSISEVDVRLPAPSPLRREPSSPDADRGQRAA